MDKYQLIDSVIVDLNTLADARGVEKCRLLLDILQRLAALKNGLKREDEEKNDEQREAGE